MAYIVGKDDKDKKNPMSLFADPGAFRNIKQQMQQDQMAQATQPVFQGPVQPNEDEQKQRFQEGDIVEIEGEGATAGYKPKQIQQTSGQFTNIQDYLAANRGRSAAIGERVAGQFEEEAGGIESERAASEKEYLGGPEGTGGYYGSDTQSFIDQSIAGAGVGDQSLSGEDAERFKQLRTGGFGVGDFREQITEAQKLEKRAGELGSSQGRFAAIRRSLGPRLQSSRRGGGRLDQAILGSDRRTSADMARRAREASSGLSERYQSLGESIQGAEKERREQLRTGLGSAREQARTDVTDLRKNIKESFREGGDYALTQEQLDTLGISGGFNVTQPALFSPNHPQFRQHDDDPINLLLGDTKITPQHQSRLEALAKLGGVSPELGYAGQYDIDRLKDIYSRNPELVKKYESTLDVYTDRINKAAADRDVNKFLAAKRSRDLYIKGMTARGIGVE